MDTQTESSTALATTTPAGALATPANDEFAKKQALAARLPVHLRDDFMLLDRPSPTQLAEIVSRLPSDTQQKLMDLVRKTRPKKQGVHTAREGFQPTDIKVYQGTGTDPLRPKNCLPGQFYTAESKVLESPFDAAVVLFYEGRTLWPPREGGQGSEGGSAKVPLCMSLDRKKGSRYGECATCPKAGQRYDQGGCTREVVAFLVDREMTGIYTMRFSKTSLGAGEALTKILAKGDEIYSRWIRFETQERTQGTNRYFVLKAAPVVDKKPENEKVEAALHPLLNAFSRLLEADVYFPHVANCYTRAENPETPEGAAAGEGVNEDELMGKTGASGSDAPDFSTPSV